MPSVPEFTAGVHLVQLIICQKARYTENKVSMEDVLYKSAQHYHNKLCGTIPCILYKIPNSHPINHHKISAKILCINSQPHNFYLWNRHLWPPVQTSS